MDKELPRTELFDELETKARNGDKKAQKLLDKIESGETFLIGGRKYKVVSL